MKTNFIYWLITALLSIAVGTLGYRLFFSTPPQNTQNRTIPQFVQRQSFCGVSSVSADWRQYIDNDLKFQFKYPPYTEATKGELGDEHVVRVIDPRTTNNDSIFTINLRVGFLLPQQVAEVLWWVNHQNSPIGPLFETMLSGHPAYGFDISEGFSDGQDAYVLPSEHTYLFVSPANTERKFAIHYPNDSSDSKQVRCSLRFDFQKPNA